MSSDKILLKCPNCNGTSLRINVMNRFKKHHFFVVWCVSCPFAQKFNERKIFGFEASKEDDYFIRKWKKYEKREGATVSDEKVKEYIETLKDDICEATGLTREELFSEGVFDAEVDKMVADEVCDA